jgi:methionyl-tRNA formyltransferase
MVVVFFGTPQFAVPTLERLLDSQHQVRGVVTQPDRPRGRGQKIAEGPVKTLALRHAVPVIQPVHLKDPAVTDAIRAWQPDIGVVVAYGRIIPESLLAVPRFGMINVHASLLPKYRGAAPVHRAVIDGDIEYGSLMAGQSVGMVTREEPLADIVAQLVAEAAAALERRAA